MRVQELSSLGGDLRSLSALVTIVLFNSILLLDACIRV